MKFKKALPCYFCRHIVLEVTHEELKKMRGLNFRCENCCHENLLQSTGFHQGSNQNDPFSNILSVEQLITPDCLNAY